MSVDVAEELRREAEQFRIIAGLAEDDVEVARLEGKAAGYRGAADHVEAALED